jgi:hypothetical protein
MFESLSSQRKAERSNPSRHRLGLGLGLGFGLGLGLGSRLSAVELVHARRERVLGPAHVDVLPRIITDDIACLG